MVEVPRWSVERLIAEAPAPVAVIADPAVARRVARLLPWPQFATFADLPAELGTLVAVGGGTLLDGLKIARADIRPDLRLVAIASLWGSGAEASPVALAMEGERKVPRLEAALAPDARVVLAELAEGLPRMLARHGCGDAWSHALEGTLSPLADEAVRSAGIQLMADMLAVGLGGDPRWFDLSARACSLQSRASVGLIHGIAHVIEGPLCRLEPSACWGHARLCAVYAWPVLHLNMQLNDKWRRLADDGGLDREAVQGCLRELFDDADFERTLPTLEERWPQVLRDPLSRSNSALVRRAHLEHFTERRFA